LATTATEVRRSRCVCELMVHIDVHCKTKRDYIIYLDFSGFRYYDSIKKVLLHELAHMVHDDHNTAFHEFNRDLTKEAGIISCCHLRRITMPCLFVFVTP